MTRGFGSRRHCLPDTGLFYTTLRGTTAAGEEFAGIEDYVVAFAVAVGAGGAEAEVGGFEDEGEFGEFSAALGVDFALAGRLGDRLLLGGLGSGGLLPERLRARR